MDVNVVKPAVAQQAANTASPTGRGDEMLIPRSSQVDNEKVKIQATENALKPETEEDRMKNMEQAARAVVTDIYAVSDSKFTIFKDASGQYITRITSLRDGRVTYIPEPELLQYMKHRSSALGTMTLRA